MTSARPIRVQVALDWNRRLMHQRPNAACNRCDVRNPVVLIMGRRPAICYRCRAMSRGRSGSERHHLGGRRSPLQPVLVDANLHRILTYLQLVWRRAGVRSGSLAAVAFDLLMIVALMPTWMPSAK